MPEVVEAGDEESREEFTCRRCGETARMVVAKCPYCKYRGKPSRKEARRGSYAMVFLPLFWPVAPFAFIRSFFMPKKGVAPFEELTRAEWRARKK